jgi:peptidoglycan hydrolase CwlO-like protein
MKLSICIQKCFFNLINKLFSIFDIFAKINIVFITSLVFFILGFVAASVAIGLPFLQVKRKLKSTEGFLESEKLIKEKHRKDSALAFQLKENIENELNRKISDAEQLIKIMDNDILLLQKDNEDTEALIKTTQPELYNLKLKLIEANNTISRLKAQLEANK